MSLTKLSLLPAELRPWSCPCDLCLTIALSLPVPPLPRRSESSISICSSSFLILSDLRNGPPSMSLRINLGVGRIVMAFLNFFDPKILNSSTSCYSKILSSQNARTVSTYLQKCRTFSGSST